MNLPSNFLVSFQFLCLTPKDYSNTCGLYAYALKTGIGLIFYNDLRKYTVENTLKVRKDIKIKRKNIDIDLKGSRIKCIRFSECGRFLAVGYQKTLLFFITKTFLGEAEFKTIEFKTNLKYIEWGEFSGKPWVLC